MCVCSFALFLITGFELLPHVILYYYAVQTSFFEALYEISSLEFLKQYCEYYLYRNYYVIK